MKAKVVGLRGVCLLLSCLFLAGCTGTPQAGGKTTTTTNTDNVSAEVTQEFLDGLKGMTIDITYPWKVEEKGASAAADRAYANKEKIESEYGVTINMNSGRSAYATVMVTSLLSGKPMGNILMCPDSYFPDWYNAGVMCDLTEAAKEACIDFSDDHFNQNVIKYTNINGGQYGFYYGYDVSSSIFYNKRIFNELGLEDPYSLKTKGEWTWDTLKEYAARAKKVDANGTVTQWGLGAWSSSDFLANAVSSNGGSVIGLANGKPSFTLGNPAGAEAMEWMYNLCNVDKILDAVDTAGWTEKMNDFIAGKYAMLLGTGSTLDFCYSLGMKDEYGVIQFPQGPSNKTGTVDTMTNITFYFIPKAYEENAAEYLFILDKMSTIDTLTSEESFAEKFGLKFCDDNSYNSYYERSQVCPNFDLIYFSGAIWSEAAAIGNISAALAMGTSTPGTLIEMYSSSMQSAIDDKWAAMTITGQ